MIRLFDFIDNIRLRKKNVYFRYSDSGEQFTGEYWLDGKKIYVKTIQINCSPTPGGFEFGDDYPFLTSLQIKDIVDYHGIFQQPGGETFQINGGWNISKSNFFCYCYIMANKHIAIMNSSEGKYTLYVKFTKTTD